MNKALSIVGFGVDRDDKDFYPTPPEATEALFEREKFKGKVWECASGDGSMSKVIEKYNICRSSDIQTTNWIYGDKGVDFLSKKLNYENMMSWTHENIITNPPYRYAKEFIEQAKRFASKKIAMLLKLVFLESKGRYEMFQDTSYPLKTVYVFCSRVKIYKRGEVTKNSGLIAYAWFVWDIEHEGKPQIEWIY